MSSHFSPLFLCLCNFRLFAKISSAPNELPASKSGFFTTHTLLLLVHAILAQHALKSAKKHF